jgi:hypothetical protein
MVFQKGNQMKKLALIIAMMVGVNFSYANEVYIEQVGDDSTVTITQDGTGNKVGTPTDTVFIGGGTNTVIIDQIGSANELIMTVNGAATNVTLNTVGSGNMQEVQCGTTTSASCSGSTISQQIVGDDNTVKQLLGSGGNHTSSISVSGSTNQVTHTSTSTGTVNANITVTGDTNVIGVTQSGITTQSVTVNSTGNSNNITINQSN